MPLPVSRSVLRSLSDRFNNYFDAVRSIEFPLIEGECPEEVGDLLRPVLAQACAGKWRQTHRGQRGFVRFELEGHPSVYR